MPEINNVTVIGGGTIGSSWAALFLAHGLHVVIHDPQPDIEEKVAVQFNTITPILEVLGYDTQFLTANLSFEPTLAKAVAQADYIQESGPENLTWKQDLFAQLDQLVSPTCLIGSSSSGFPIDLLNQGCQHAGNMVTAHPFNPPHLIPLVELYFSAASSAETIQRVEQFMTRLHKKVVVLHKSVKGFIANRLQAAVLRECIALVKAGVVDMKGIDDVMTNSIGLRWAVGGPFETFHVGGGSKGLIGLMETVGVMMETNIWPDLATTVQVDAATKALLHEQVDKFYGPMNAELTMSIARKQLAVIKAVKPIVSQHPESETY